jgi:hypothetical protein
VVLDKEGQGLSQSVGNTLGRYLHSRHNSCRELFVVVVAAGLLSGQNLLYVRAHLVVRLAIIKLIQTMDPLAWGRL